MKIIYVEWIDSCVKSGWSEIETHKKTEPILCKTVGFLLADDDKKIVVTQSFSDEMCTESATIPKVNIKKRKFLKL